MKSQKFITISGAAACLALLFEVSSVNAATITINDTASVLNLNTTAIVSGFLEPVGGLGSGTQNLSTDKAKLFSGPPNNSSPATETNFLNNSLMADPTATFLKKQDPPLAVNGQYSVSAKYFSLKLGNEWAFFRNDTGGTIAFSLSTDQSHGLSHISEYSVVPLPAAAWLFGSALMGVVGVGYRRKPA